jgi:hypothetical protein
MATETICIAVSSPRAVEVTCAYLADIPLCGVATDARSHLAVKMFAVLIHYFVWKNVDCRQNSYTFTVNQLM